MKKLILVISAAILMVLSTSLAQSDLIAPGSRDAVSALPEISSDPSRQDSGLSLKSIKEIKPIYRTPRHGDRLWDYVRQYNLGHPREIVEFNNGKAGEKCIKNENLILRGCEIEIPAYTEVQIQVQQGFNERIFERAVEREKETKEAESRMHWGLLAIAVIFLGGLALLFFKFYCAVERENERLKLGNATLSSKLWEAEDKFKNEENRVKRLSDMLQESYDVFSAKDRALKRAQTEIARMADSARFLHGDETELEFREK